MTKKSLLVLGTGILIGLGVGFVAFRPPTAVAPVVTNRNAAVNTSTSTIIGACTTDADCVRAGCNDELCVMPDAQIVSICDATPSKSCRRQDQCGCVNSLCAWADSDAYRQCVSDATNPDSTPPTGLESE